MEIALVLLEIVIYANMYKLISLTKKTEALFMGDVHIPNFL